MRKADNFDSSKWLVENKITTQSRLNENKLSYRDLKPGNVYRYDIEIQQGPMKGEKFTTDEEFIGNDGYNLIFKITKIYTPETAKYLGKKIGDTSRTGEGAISRDYSEIKLENKLTPASQKVNEDSISNFEIGDKFKVTKSPDSKIMQYLKSAVSAFYDRKIQPQVGDVFEVLPNEFKEFEGKEYTLKNINRPEEFIKALGPIADEAIVSMPKKWVDALYSKGYFTKVN